MPKFFSRDLDVSVAVKLAVVLTLLVMTIPVFILPQLDLLKEAGDALCGALACCGVPLCLSACMCVSGSYVKFGSGGQTDFAVGVGKDGVAWWVKTDVSNATQSKWEWQQSNAELGSTPFSSQLANQMLLAKKLPEDSEDCWNETSSFNFSALSFASYPERCWTINSNQYNIDNLERLLTRSLTKLSSEWQYSNQLCMDVLQSEYFDKWGYEYVPLIAAAVADTLSNSEPRFSIAMCPGGCTDALKPLCDNGQCVTPRCSHLRLQCGEETRRGNAARLFCPASCGCGNAFSGLTYQYGCPSGCLAKHKEQIAARPCTDMPVGSKELATFTITNGHSYSLDAALGCESPSMQTWDLCDESVDYKSLKGFCPKACNCSSGENGCPLSCPKAP